MTSYLDASCLLRRLIGDGPMLERPDLWEAAVASETDVVATAAASLGFETAGV